MIIQRNKVSLVSRVKTVAALPAAAGILRSTAHSAEQGRGERSQSSSTTDHSSGPPGRRETAQAQAQAQTGVRDNPRQAKGVPVSSIYALGIRRVAPRTASIGEKSIHELFRVVIATAADRGARDGSRPAITAAFPPHCVASKQDSVAKTQQARF